MTRLLRFIYRLWAAGVSVTLCGVLVFFSAQAVVEHGFAGSGDPHAECGLVFGAAVVGAHLPGSAIVRRITKAVQMVQSGNITRLIVSGGFGVGQPRSESDVMREQAIAQGLKTGDITLESASRSTWENIAYSKPLVKDCTTVLGVSDRYHLARIRLIAYRQGWGNLPTVPATTGEKALPKEGESEFREILGILYYGLYADFLVKHSLLPHWVVS